MQLTACQASVNYRIIISSRYARVMAQDQVAESGFREPTTQYLYAQRKYSGIRG